MRTDAASMSNCGRHFRFSRVAVGVGCGRPVAVVVPALPSNRSAVTHIESRFASAAVRGERGPKIGPRRMEGCLSAGQNGDRA